MRDIPPVPAAGSVSLAALAIVLAGALAGCVAPAGPAPAHEVAAETIVLETQAGPITILLYPEAAPNTVSLMRTYVREGYYVGKAFARTVPGHVIQVTDATGGALDDPRRVPLEVDGRHHFAAGAVGTARDTDPASGGPELFIMDYATSHLDGNYTVWGQVIDGMEAVHDIARSPALAPPRSPGVPAPVPAPLPIPAAGLPFDRLALTPITITGARLANATLPAAQAAAYPLQVARNVAAQPWRHSLEAPADLRAGVPAHLTWYIRDGQGGDVPDRIAVQANGTVLEGPARPGMYPFTWTPGRSGWQELALAEPGPPGSPAAGTVTLRLFVA